MFFTYKEFSQSGRLFDGTLLNSVELNSTSSGISLSDSDFFDISVISHSINKPKVL
jgi:hypothetical protein